MSFQKGNKLYLLKKTNNMILKYTTKKESAEDIKNSDQGSTSGIIGKGDELSKDWLSKGLKKNPNVQEKDDHKNNARYWLGKKRGKFGTPFKKGETAGEKNRNWKGGITPLRMRIRQLFEYRQWRSDCFTRDDFTCQWCGKRGCYLEIDHYPKRFSDICDEYNIKSIDEALNCQELWNLNNGRTLCRDCHNKTKWKKKNVKI